MSSNEPVPTSSGDSRKLRIKYDEVSARHANQVLINATREEVFLDFSSGPVPDGATGATVVPIHTRMAMTLPAARRLLAGLQQALKRAEASAAESNS